MCGRARCSLAREAVTAAAGVPEQRWQNAGQYRPSYNCSPGAYIPVIRMGADGARELYTMKWGLVPGFTRLGPGERADHYRMFNARSESLAQKSVFSRLLPGKRCVVLLDGFYEWLGGQAGGRKQPYHITTADGPQQPAMYLAGLYDVYRDPSGDVLHTFTIITTDSSKPLAWLHCRMPVILTTPEEVAAWLGEGGSAGAPVDHEQCSPPSPKPQTLQLPCSSHPSVAAAGAIGSGSHPDAAERDLASANSERETGDAAGEAAKQTGKGKLDDGDGACGPSGADSGADDDLGSQGAATPNKAAAEGGSPRSGGKGRRKEDDGCRQELVALVERLCRPYGGPLLRWHPVTPDMSKPGYDKPDCCKDVRTKKGSIGSFFKPAARTTGAGIAQDSHSPIKKELHPQPTGVQGSSPPIVKAEAQEQQKGMTAVKSEAGATRNPDECEGAGGDAALPGTRTGSGLKRKAEDEAEVPEGSVSVAAKGQ